MARPNRSVRVRRRPPAVILNKAMSLIVVQTAPPGWSFAIPFSGMLLRSGRSRSNWVSWFIGRGPGASRATRDAVGDALPCPGGATGGDRGDAGGDAFGARVTVLAGRVRPNHAVRRHPGAFHAWPGMPHRTDQADGLEAARPEWFAAFLADRGTRKPSMHTLKAANRFYIHAGVVDEFTTRFGAAVEALTVGAAADGAEIGPLISGRAVQGVDALVRQAIAAGAHISHRAPVPDSKGWFYPPTVLADVPADADILDAEIFGPVAPIVAWHHDSELLKLVNASEMGLAVYVYAGELQRAMRLGEAFDAGMVGVNRGVVSDPSAPFGGVKQSGSAARAPAPVSRNSRRLSTSASTEPVHETSVSTRLVG